MYEYYVLNKYLVCTMYMYIVPCHTAGACAHAHARARTARATPAQNQPRKKSRERNSEKLRETALTGQNKTKQNKKQDLIHSRAT